MRVDWACWLWPEENEKLKFFQPMEVGLDGYRLALFFINDREGQDRRDSKPLIHDKYQRVGVLAIGRMKAPGNDDLWGPDPAFRNAGFIEGGSRQPSDRGRLP